MKANLALAPGSDLQQRLAELSEALSREIQVSALQDAAEPMRAAIAAHAPRSSEPHQHLADHIAISSARITGEDGIKSDTPAVAIGPEKGFWRGRFPEFGTAHMAAEPFMRPGYDETVDRSFTILNAAIWNAIKRHASGGAVNTGGGLL